MAGTAHFDQYGLLTGGADTGRRAGVEAWFDTMLHPTSQPDPRFSCGSPINAGPQTYVLRAALSHLDRWAAGGRPPPRAPRLETVGTTPAVYALDANGIVRGGIRSPAVDAPVAKLSGLGQTGTTFCFLFGTTVPFTDAQLQALYGTHDGFVTAWNRATRSAANDGFLLPTDASHMRAAASSDILG